jgi:3-dehydroquinate dehydratase/shikimate dehydrogenase
MQPRKPVICIPICERTIGSLEQTIVKTEPFADVLEIRLDCLDPFQVQESFSHLKLICESVAKPTILTYRPAAQGGKQELTFGHRFTFWVFNRPDTNGFFDIELDFAGNSFLFDYGSAPDWNRVICSYHDFMGMPEDLDGLYDQMVKTPARILKIAVQADDVVDCLGLFHLLERARQEERELIPIAMGTPGLVTRILGPSRGGFLTYAALDDKAGTAPGQTTATDLREVYRVEKLNRDTEIFGVVGLPIYHSASPAIHNAAFKTSGMNAVYIPFEVRDLSAFMRRMVHPRTREIDWQMRGLSITAPHKRAVMDHLDWVEPAAREIGAVNTILIDDEGIQGYNTDAFGFISPLKERSGDLQDARCAVIGGGGAASAAISALLNEVAAVTVFVRNLERAKPLTERFGVPLLSLEGASFSGFDVVVNATVLGTAGKFEQYTPASAEQLGGARLAYDLVYNPSETRFLREARKAGCETLGGLPMFVAQAAGQFRLWTGREAPVEVMHAAAVKALAEPK